MNDHTEEEHTLNPEASVFFPPNTTLPRLTGKHKKSKVNEKAENEFLQATIDTLKATLAKNGLEIKKLKESNDIKTKRIMNLETQIEEARNNYAMHQCPNMAEASIKNVDENYTNRFQDVKIALLENMTNSLEQ